VDAFIDCVGFEAKGSAGTDQPAVVLNEAMEVTRPAGSIGIPGLYVTEDPGAKDEHAKHGSLSLRLGQGWSRSHSFHTGQTPVLRYNRQLLQAILWDRLPIAKIVNAKVITSMPHPRVTRLSIPGLRINSSSIRTAASHDDNFLAASCI